MTPFEHELRENFERFTSDATSEAHKAAEILDSQKATFFASYARIVSLQAWRVEVLERTLSGDALAFYLEAQNDALLSHLFARMGMWRPALQSLRSTLENVLQALFYKDHPIELRLWKEGKHRLAFKEIRLYLKEHPDLQGPATKVADVPALDKEYSTLSRAVHGSTVSFRATATSGKPLFFRPDAADLGRWTTREKNVITGLNVLMAALFRGDLSGARALNLRRTLHLVIPPSTRASLKSIGVTLLS